MPRFTYLQLHLLVALFGATAILGRLISLSAPALVAWRSLLAVAGGVVLIGIMRRKLLPPARVVLRLLGIGVIVGFHWLCFFGAVKLANISICLAGMATTSFFTAFSEPLFDRRRVRPLEVWLGLLVVVGIVMVAGGLERGRLLGLAVALLGALLASVFPVLNRRFVNRGELDPLVMMVWEMAGVWLVCLACLRWLDGPGAYGRLFALRDYDWAWLLMLAWACTLFAYAFHIHLLRHISAYTSNLALNFEPVYGILAAALLFGEHRQVHPGFYFGATTIIIANLAHPILLHRLSGNQSC